MGAAFLGLALLLYLRGRGVGASGSAAIGVALVLAGLAVPGRLGPVYRGWMGLAHILSRITTPVFMGVVYFLVIAPIGTIMRLAGRQPMRVKSSGRGFWQRRDPATTDSGMDHQF